ncbi:MAG: ThiF family adenylyltransferase [Actinomycetota bacterium]
MKTWVDRFPERFEYEREQFVARGLNFELDEQTLDDLGLVVLRGSLAHQGTEIRLEVHYPDFFPYLRPEVVAPDLELHRHQNPFDRNLCLLDRSTRAWNPSDTGAWLVAERVPHLLELLEGDESELQAAEVPQGEPASVYFGGIPGAVIFLPAEVLTLAKDARAGSGRIGCTALEPPRIRLRGAVVELVEKGRNRKTRTLAKVGSKLSDRFGAQSLSFRWARLDSAPEGRAPEDVFKAIDSARPGFGSPPWQAAADGQIAISAAVFPEEVEQGQLADGWIFAVKARTPGGGKFEYIIRGERLTDSDLATRLPFRARLADHQVALVGLGALGGEIGIELTKAGIDELRGLDFDHVEAGTIVRWFTGLSAVGHLKTQVMESRIGFDYPFTEFKPFTHQLGGSAVTSTARTETELDVMDRFLTGVDLVIDATAEIGVQQLVAALADERSLPQVFVSATEGAQGGLVARIRPGSSSGCWLCLQWHLETGSIPLPAHEQGPTEQPRGCASLTFTGAGFDLLPIAAQGTRVAAATLTEPEEDSSSQVFVCSLPDEPAHPPSWQSFPLEAHPDCPNCSG